MCEIREGKIEIKDFITGETIIATLTKDDMFWGGYKIKYDNCILSINIVKDIKYVS